VCVCVCELLCLLWGEVVRLAIYFKNINIFSQMVKRYILYGELCSTFFF
jgi:hypothetical protein